MWRHRIPNLGGEPLRHRCRITAKAAAPSYLVRFETTSWHTHCFCTNYGVRSIIYVAVAVNYVITPTRSLGHWAWIENKVPTGRRCCPEDSVRVLPAMAPDRTRRVLSLIASDPIANGHPLTRQSNIHQYDLCGYRAWSHDCL